MALIITIMNQENNTEPYGVLGKQEPDNIFAAAVGEYKIAGIVTIKGGVATALHTLAKDSSELADVLGEIAAESFKLGLKRRTHRPKKK